MPPEPRILAIDTSAAACAAALLCGDQIVAFAYEPMQKGQVERLFPMLEELLGRLSLGWSDLNAIAVCTGPGNFTGVRLGVSAARGLALSLNIPAVGITAFEAFATGHKSRVVALVKAPRDQVYLQIFDNETSVSQPKIIDVADLASKTQADDIFAGDNAADLARQFGRGHVPVNVDQPTTCVLGIAKLAKSRLGTPCPRPAPLYLRPANAALPSEPPVVILP